MLRSVASKAAWVGRTASMVFGLALVLALVLGVATTALSVTGANLILGKHNAAEHPTSLVSTLNDAIKPALNVHNKSGGPALRLGVAPEQAPIKVNAAAGTAKNLSADELDGNDSAAFQRADAAAGGDLTGNYPNPQIGSGAVGTTELATLPTVHAFIFGSQLIPHSSNSFTLLQFPDESFDQVGTGQSGEMHTTTNNSRLTAPRDGIYQINVEVGWFRNATGIRTTALEKNNNGACDRNRIALDRVNATPEGDAYNHIGTLVALNQGDYVEVCVQQTSGANLAATSLSFATMHYVSGQ